MTKTNQVFTRLKGQIDDEIIHPVSGNRHLLFLWQNLRKKVVSNKVDKNFGSFPIL